ncbi:hypothetical protein GN958_ATG04568 [Phytophthora infestans]|uniref:Uncharacterized protein n=1 Tax=Phytophthora infestans TaxID=4787 RepID=A0A8S9UYU6_PHYIN|nr:hypothetical protein GN958_ATG04568 [Phytophthora infestans]
MVRVLGLMTADGQRLFDAIHSSRNSFLFRDHFRMDVAAFDALFEICQPFIVDTVRNQRTMWEEYQGFSGNEDDSDIPEDEISSGTSDSDNESSSGSESGSVSE